MRKTIVVCAAILGYIVVFGSLTCLLLPVGSFYSLAQRSEIQALPMFSTDTTEYLTYRTKISFGGGMFNQQESDYFYAGSYTCRFGRIRGYDYAGSLLAAGYSPLLGVLLWNQQVYFNVVQLTLVLILLLAVIKIYKRSQESPL